MLKYKRGAERPAHARVEDDVPGLADGREESTLRLDALREAVGIEHPHDEHVLKVVPDVQHEPPGVDVGNQQVPRREDRDVARHVRAVGSIRPPAAEHPQLSRDPQHHADRGHDPDHVEQPGRDREGVDRQAEKRRRLLMRPGEDAPERQRVDDTVEHEVARGGNRAGLAQVHPRDAVALTRVVEPLRVEIHRGDEPFTHDERDARW